MKYTSGRTNVQIKKAKNFPTKFMYNPTLG